MRHLAIAALAATLMCAGAAQAVEVTFTGHGATSSTDPLGDAWTTDGFGFGEPGIGLGTIAFNPAGNSSGLGTFATSFRLTVSSNTGGVDFTDASLADINNLAVWAITQVDDFTVLFTAPDGSPLSQGDVFYVAVPTHNGFNVDSSFTATWGDGGGVPEPATWGLMLLGLFGAGAALRARQRPQFAG